MSTMAKEEDVQDIQQPVVQTLVQRSQFNRYIAGDVFQPKCGPGERWMKFLKLPADVHAVILNAPSTSQKYDPTSLNSCLDHGCIFYHVEDVDPEIGTCGSGRSAFDMAGQENATINPALLMSRKDDLEHNSESSRLSHDSCIQQSQPVSFTVDAEKHQLNFVDKETAEDGFNSVFDSTLPDVPFTGSPLSIEHTAFSSTSISPAGNDVGYTTDSALAPGTASAIPITSQHSVPTVDQDAALARMLAQVWQSEDLGRVPPSTRSNRHNQASSTAIALPHGVFDQSSSTQKPGKKQLTRKRLPSAVKSTGRPKRAQAVSKNKIQSFGAPHRIPKVSKRSIEPTPKVVGRLKSCSAQKLEGADQPSDSESCKLQAGPEVADEDIDQDSEAIGRPHRRFGAKGLTVTSPTGETYFQEANIPHLPPNSNNEAINAATESEFDARQSFDEFEPLKMGPTVPDDDAEDSRAMEAQFHTTDHGPDASIQSIHGLTGTPPARNFPERNVRADKILKKKYSKSRMLAKAKQVITENTGGAAFGHKKKKNPPWSDDEYQMLYRGLKHRRDYEASNEDVRKLADVSFWSVVLESLYAQGLSRTRTCSAARFFWSRQGRARSGFDERQNKSPVLITCAQSSRKTKKNKKAGTRSYKMRSNVSQKAENSVDEKILEGAQENVKGGIGVMEEQSKGKSVDDEYLNDETEEDDDTDEWHGD